MCILASETKRRLILKNYIKWNSWSYIGKKATENTELNTDENYISKVYDKIQCADAMMDCVAFWLKMEQIKSSLAQKKK